MSDFRLRDLVAPSPPRPGGAVLVTGASSGIGEATALRLSISGWRVFAGVRRDADAERLDATHHRIVPLHIDLDDDDTLGKAAIRIDELAPEGLAGLINNAGLAAAGPIEILERHDWERVLSTNVVGTAMVTRAMLPALLRAGGRIITIGSGQGRVAFPLFAPYAASKFAIVAFSDSLRREVGPQGASVTLIEPGVVTTKAIDTAMPRVQELLDSLSDDVRSRYGDMIENALAAASNDGLAPQEVAELIDRVLAARRLRKRYHLGADGAFVSALGRYAPPWLQDVVVAKLTR